MTNRVVLGLFDGAYRLRVSKPGFNVLNTALGPDGLVFDSQWTATMRLHQSGVASHSGIGSGGVVKMATWPDLGFDPLCFVLAPKGTVPILVNSDGVIFTSSTGLYEKSIGGIVNATAFYYYCIATPVS